MNDPKTAKQHNASQVGESEFKPNPPPAFPKMPDVTAPNPAKVPEPPKLTGKLPVPRPWSLRDLKDTRDNVRESVAAAAFVPPGAKAMLLEIIDLSFPNARLLALDAHVHAIERNSKKSVDVCLTISEI